ncbi:MAG: polysaccharide deacetylase family protein [Novosphingobium sp.]
MMRLLRMLLLALSLLAAPAAHADKRIALTFDDVPRARGSSFSPDERAALIVSSLKHEKVRQAAFFINPGRLAEPDGVGGEARIVRYAAAGHVIANHGYSHLALTAVSSEAYLADIDRAEAWLKGKPGRRPWFRFPFLNEGGGDKAKRDAVRAGLASRKLSNAYVTVDAADWQIDAMVTAAKAAGKTIDPAGLRDFFIARHVEAANYNDELARRTLGRAPVQVMLLHETDVTASYIALLVQALRKDGWTIETADKAYADPIYRLQPDVPHSTGTLTERLAWEKGLPAPRWYRYLNSGEVTRLFNQQVLGETQSR